MKNFSKNRIGFRGRYQALGHFRMRSQAKGRARVSVLDETRAVIRELALDNLILNQGLNGLTSRVWCDSFLYCCAGDGAGVNSVDSGVTTATQSGTTVTLAGGAFVFTDTATDAGKMIKWDSAQEAMIVTVTDPTHAEVNVSQAVPGGEFTVFNTQLVGLGNEIVRSNTYLTGAGNCGTSQGGNVLTHKRTFDFPTEVGGVTYREIGLSWSAVAGDNLFSRIKLPSDVTLVAGQSLRVEYSLLVTWTPETPNAKTADIIGWPVAPATTTDGAEQIQYFGSSAVDTSGATVEFDSGGYCNEPGILTDVGIFISTDATALSSLGSSADRTGTSPAVRQAEHSSYTANSFTIDKRTVFPVDEANSTAWRSVGIGKHEFPGPGLTAYTLNGFVFLFDEAQTKDSLHTLELVFTNSWGRTLA